MGVFVHNWGVAVIIYSTVWRNDERSFMSWWLSLCVSAIIVAFRNWVCKLHTTCIILSHVNSNFWMTFNFRTKHTYFRNVIWWFREIFFKRKQNHNSEKPFFFFQKICFSLEFWKNSILKKLIFSRLCLFFCQNPSN